MEKHLPPPGIPCPFLKVGQCPYGDGCEYAHDFMAQPCLSSAQIDYQMRSLEHARPADRNERAKVKRRKAQLRRLGARKLAAPALFERGVVPTKKAIKRELGRYTVGPPNNITFLAVREKVFMDGGADDDDDDDGEWQTVGINRLRRKRKIVARMGQRNVRILGMSRRSGANVCYPFQFRWVAFVCNVSSQVVYGIDKHAGEPTS
ncbi:hypothetical protein L873DRAFT_795552 [Choiromyces venosus 120613-1]|uniref:C3H1-type domain-containing protein n=1 Tax=Choiromyces venosus 120613-1 TaxID=1336337 RepID=A0A3N4K4K0_9PEZI|nr:hypothetical protein L873DRAFT_795552 [Choiromyces venosus 120613-1]